jgi:hypothetical protein
VVVGTRGTAAPRLLRARQVTAREAEGVEGVSASPPHTSSSSCRSGGLDQGHGGVSFWCRQVVDEAVRAARYAELS